MAEPAGTPPTPPQADAVSLPSGLRLADYVIERPLGGGGFGITYLARDSNLQLPVAIKEYYPSELVSRGGDHSVLVRAGSDQQEQYDWGLERFLDEARALATFRHPNIVRVLRYFREHGTAYIVMEYESGLPLKKWVPQNAPLSQRTLLSIIYPLLDGLEAVHKTGFLHRDIKPDNIYVRADGTPVLLDFGAARRVSSQTNLTNIVSPGFAPFEQYHSHGNQGPWTDIYSLGAVMYWMTTGKKPMESAARVKKDEMLSASTLADAAVYGEALLQAVDWALHPDESRRPQTVSLFRAAIQGSEQSGPGEVDIELRADLPAFPPGPHGPSMPASGVSAIQRRNVLCTIMFLDLVGYSQRSVDDQVAIKRLFNDMLGKAVKGIPEETRIAIDTGDGAAICFMGDPEEALNCAMLLRDLMSQRRGASVRIGLHMGPVRVVADINNRQNVVGDGINVAQRVMDFAEGNQVMVSRPYYDVISRIADDTADMFQYMGQYEDKHGRLHELYMAQPRGLAGTTRREGPSTGYTQTLPVKGAQALDDAEVHEVESELARLIGPLARVLVRKARERSPSVAALRMEVAATIPDAKARETFLAGGSSSHAPGNSHPLSGTRRPGSSRPATPSRFGALGPSSASIPLGPSGPSQGHSRSVPFSSSQPSNPSRTAANPRLDLSPDDLAAVEQHLSKFIGPMARMLVRKEASRATGVREFVAAVAATIDHPAEREQFIAALRRALPRQH